MSEEKRGRDYFKLPPNQQSLLEYSRSLRKRGLMDNNGWTPKGRLWIMTSQMEFHARRTLGKVWKK